MFKELLNRILSRAPGALAISVMGFDGIPLDGQNADPSASVRHQTTVVELGNLANQVRRMSDDVGTGAVKEFCVSTDAMTTILRPITNEYFIAMSLKDGANLGKARFLMRTSLPELRSELI